MIICLYFTLTWIIFLSLISTGNKLGLIKASFLFLTVCLLNSHFYLLISENFKGFTVSDKTTHYISFILWKTLIVPAFLVLSFKISRGMVAAKYLILLSGGFFALCMAVVDEIGKTVGLYTYEWWNLFWSLLYFYSLYLSTYCLYQLFIKLEDA